MDNIKHREVFFRDEDVRNSPMKECMSAIDYKNIIALKTSCDGRGYTSLSVSPDGKKIIAQRIDVESGLCLMDIDGKNEVIIK